MDYAAKLEVILTTLGIKTSGDCDGHAPLRKSATQEDFTRRHTQVGNAQHLQPYVRDAIGRQIYATVRRSRQTHGIVFMLNHT